MIQMTGVVFDLPLCVMSQNLSADRSVNSHVAIGDIRLLRLDTPPTSFFLKFGTSALGCLSYITHIAQADLPG